MPNLVNNKVYMSRIGKKSISIPTNVTVTVDGKSVAIKGPKGELTVGLKPNIAVSIEDNEVSVKRKKETKEVKALHGLVRSLLNNAIIGVAQGYKKTLKLVGTGYRAQAKGTGISLAIGFSHPVDVAGISSVKLSVEGTDTIHIEGIDKQAVGQVAANIRKLRPPEPYKGKGIRYEDEVVRRKQGKTVA